MKKVLLVTASLIALGATAPAVAADLAARPYTKAPPMVAAVYDWTGFYIGANGGWGSSRNSWDSVAPALVGSEGSHDATGGTVGGQIGYRWQAGTLVFGVEAQGNWADFSGSNTSLVFPGFRNHTNVDAFGLFTGQVGYAVNNVLLYVKGGAAVTSNSYRINTVGGALAGVTGDDTRWGGTIGARPRIRLRPELVGWRRVQSPVHAGPYLQLHHAGRPRIRRRSHPSGRRSRHRPPELQVRRPGCRAILIFRDSRELSKPRALPGAFLCVRRPGAVNHAGIVAKRARETALDS